MSERRNPGWRVNVRLDTAVSLRNWVHLKTAGAFTTAIGGTS